MKLLFTNKTIKKLSILLILSVFVFSIKAQQAEFNKTMYDEMAGEEILIGLCNRAGLESGLFEQYFETSYNEYTPEVAIVEKINNSCNPDEWQITIVLATWCYDSQMQVPAFFALLDKTRFSEQHYEILCVDRQKLIPGKDITALSILRVPTFIFYYAGNEVGRIVETPEVSLEEDMLEIIKRKQD